MTDPGTSAGFDHGLLVKPSSSNRTLWWFGLVMLVGILVLAWIGRPPMMVTVGKPLPPLDLQPLLDGTQPVTHESLSGKWAVIHFWGTWCPPCKQEFPEFVKLVEQFADSNQVAIVSVSCSGGPEYDLEELRLQTTEFMAQYNSSVPTYSDPAAMTRQQLALILPNGSMGYPTTLLVDPQGKIVSLLNGYLPGDMQKLAQQLKSHLP